MTRIDKQSLIQRLVRQGQTTTASTAAGSAGKKSSAVGGGGFNSASLGFQERVAIGLAAIDPAAANSTHKALEVYVGAALLDAFGAELVNDPAFAHLLSDVLAGLAQSPDHATFTAFVKTELNHVKR